MLITLLTAQISEFHFSMLAEIAYLILRAHHYTVALKSSATHVFLIKNST